MQGYIKDIKFETLGYVVIIVVSSILTETEVVKGRSLEEASKTTKEDILKNTGSLPSNKIHCSMLGIDALHTAIKNYKQQ